MVHGLVRDMALEGLGASRIAARLNELGFVTRRGTPYSQQRVDQIVSEVFPVRGNCRAIARHRRELLDSMEALKDEAGSNPAAARFVLHMAEAREGGADLLDAVDVAVARTFEAALVA